MGNEHSRPAEVVALAHSRVSRLVSESSDPSKLNDPLFEKSVRDCLDAFLSAPAKIAAESSSSSPASNLLRATEPCFTTGWLRGVRVAWLLWHSPSLRPELWHFESGLYTRLLNSDVHDAFSDGVYAPFEVGMAHAERVLELSHALGITVPEDIM